MVSEPGRTCLFAGAGSCRRRRNRRPQCHCAAGAGVGCWTQAHDPCALLGVPGKEFVATGRTPSGCMVRSPPTPAMTCLVSYKFSVAELGRWRASVPSQRTAYRSTRLAAVRRLAACGCPKLCRGWSGGSSVFVDEAAAACRWTFRSCCCPLALWGLRRRWGGGRGASSGAKVQRGEPAQRRSGT